MQQCKRMAAELFGTFWLVFGGCGAAVLAAGGSGGIGRLGVSLAFGLTVVTMAYAIGAISGCHLNPAVTVGLAASGRFPSRHVPAYIVAQVAGAIVAACLLLHIASGRPGYSLAVDGLAANGFDAASPGGYGASIVFLTEAVSTFGFVLIIIGATGKKAHAAMAPLAIGLALTLIHLITIPVSNTSVNPARSTGPALLMGGLALQQLWMFWAAPTVGALAAGLLARLACPAEE